MVSRTVLEKPAIEGESPVGENHVAAWVRIPSKPEHAEFWLNPGRPRSKAKYHQ